MSNPEKYFVFAEILAEKDFFRSDFWVTNLEVAQFPDIVTQKLYNLQVTISINFQTKLKENYYDLLAKV